MTDVNPTPPPAAGTISPVQDAEAPPAPYNRSPYGLNAATPTHVVAPLRNPLGVVAFILAVVMLVAVAFFAMTTAVSATEMPMDQFRLLLFAQAVTNVLLSLVVVVLATVSLVLKNRRRMLGAIALGAGGYAFLASVLSFVGGVIASTVT